MSLKKCVIFWLSLILMMMILAGCSTVTISKQCVEFPKGGKAVGDVYKRLDVTDRKVMNEYFNRIYKFSQLSLFCK